MKMELLNSEGPILVAEIVNGFYVIYNSRKKVIMVLTQPQLQDFVHGGFKIIDGNKVYLYRKCPGDMKPDLKTLDEFIGISTEGKSY